METKSDYKPILIVSVILFVAAILVGVYGNMKLQERLDVTNSELSILKSQLPTANDRFYDFARDRFIAKSINVTYVEVFDRYISFARGTQCGLDPKHWFFDSETNKLQLDFGKNPGEKSMVINQTDMLFVKNDEIVNQTVWCSK